MTPQIYPRTLVAGDPLRNTAVAWSRGGGLVGDVWLKGDDPWKLDRRRLSATWDEADDDLWTAVRIPDDAPPGDYTLQIGSVTWPVQVIEPPARKGTLKIIAPGSSLSEVQHTLNQNSYAKLGAGDHYWHGSLTGTAGSVLDCSAGTRIFRLPNGEPNERVIVPEDGFTVFGAHFDLRRGQSLLHTDASPSGVVVSGCEVNGGNLGWGVAGISVIDCLLRCGCPLAPPGVWLRNRFRDTPAGGEAFKSTGGILAMIDCDFARTDRGPIWQAGPEAVADSPLIVGLRCRDIDRGNNGNEILMAESGIVIQDAVILHTRVRGCLSNVLQLTDADHANGYVRDLAMHGGGGIWMVRCQGWTVENFELTDTMGIHLEDQAIRNTFRRGAVVGWKPSRVNQTWYLPSWYCPRPAILADGPHAATNRVEDCEAVGLPAGVVPYEGVNWVETA